MSAVGNYEVVTTPVDPEGDGWIDDYVTAPTGKVWLSGFNKPWTSEVENVFIWVNSDGTELHYHAYMPSGSKFYLVGVAAEMGC